MISASTGLMDRLPPQDDAAFGQPAAAPQAPVEATIIQRKLGKRLTFQFGPEKLTYTIQDYSGEKQFSVFYESIGVLDPSILKVNQTRRLFFGLRILGLILIAAILYQASRNAQVPVPLVGAFMILVLGTSLANYLKLFTIKYTVLQLPAGTVHGPVRIINDKHHAKILAELQARWKARIKKLHAAVNFANDPAKETAKFTWLRDRGVLSETEYHEALARLQGHASMAEPRDPAYRLN
jgi:hypothetical protein